MLDEGAPIFSQIAAGLAADIAAGTLAEGDRVPSTNELAAFYRINPATAAKGINVLTDSGLVEKRRGVGMFVLPGAVERLGGGQPGWAGADDAVAVGRIARCADWGDGVVRVGHRDIESVAGSAATLHRGGRRGEWSRAVAVRVRRQIRIR